MLEHLNKASFLALTSTQSRFEYWSDFINKYNCKNIAEIGVWKGEFAEAVLNSCDVVQEYYLVDPWKSLDDWNKPFNVTNIEFTEIYAEAMGRTKPFQNKCIVIRDRTIEAGKKISDDSLDFVYIDGDHTLRGITLDLNVMLPKIAEGGFLAGDDFTHSPWQHSSEFEPTLIFPYAVYFAEAKGLPIYALGKNQFVIYKRPDLGFSFNDLTSTYSDANLLSLYEKG